MAAATRHVIVPEIKEKHRVEIKNNIIILNMYTLLLQ
jgi:hypothetical protein